MSTIKVKQGGEWVSIQQIGVTSFEEAPTDGKQYIRKNGTWDEFNSENLASKTELNSKDDKVLIVSINSSEVNQQLQPNTYYKFGECTSLTITLAEPSNPNTYNEYMFEFSSGDSATILSVPENLKWIGGSTPTINSNKIYQVSIVNNIIIIGEA